MSMFTVFIATVKVHPVYLINGDSGPSGCQPSLRANRLGLWVSYQPHQHWL